MKGRRRGGTKRRWSLRTRLVVSAVTLIAIVGTVIGAVTTIAYRSYLYDQLDAQVQAIAKRAAGPPPPGKAPTDAESGLPTGAGSGAESGTGDGDRSSGNLPEARDPLKIVTGGGAPLGTVGIELTADGSVGRGLMSSLQKNENTWPPIAETPLSKEQKAAIAAVPQDNAAHTVTLPDGVDYRVQYVVGVNGAYLVGVPAAQVQDSLTTLVLVEVCVTVAALIAAGIAGSALVGVALRPLRRVATTATRVSELPLHSGEVAPLVRVPAAEADPRTEVGQVGAALNRMLGHVGSALAARQESETRVRQFVADAGHELRTPLASIRGYAELTRRGREETGPDTRRALGRIEAEAERMTGLVEDLLLLARLDAGRPLSYESTDLSPLVVDAVSDAHAAGQDHHWRLELPEPDEPSATVYGDASRLHQVLVNLLANARTHTPPGTTVTARVRRSDGGYWGGGPWDVWSSGVWSSAKAIPDGGVPAEGFPDGGALSGGGSSVVLEVQDDGPGIPPELLPHVFERFARGDASRSRAAGSTGLGLAIVQAVVTAHGGTVTVQSVPGRTVFSVRLPGPPAKGQAHPSQGQQRPQQRPSGPGRDSQTGHSLTTLP
ncbi:HAMP domain-containing sensor histidine kinase [Streptomyces scopuliridis]|uniref:HAMP domain-containing sensor histidine kinase n=1 Tax=Streptomyces scopuliridis TaxID=452529 RepID=UPI00342D168F